NYLPVSGSFSISYGETKRIHEDLTPIPVKGKINITSDPPGAMVFINGVLIGITPVDAYEVDPGYYEVVIIKAGYRVSVKGVSVSAGETEVVNVVLTPIE
ncbi:MAG: PEGA domain-containing protein, partial [Thermotogae bacterium]|nr:PEGA domain-containing protein [Thermotogota bacterium]